MTNKFVGITLLGIIGHSQALQDIQRHNNNERIISIFETSRSVVNSYMGDELII